MTSQNFSHMFTPVIPDINQLNESMGGVWKGSRERQGLMNYGLVELAIGLIIIKISNSPTWYV